MSSTIIESVRAYIKTFPGVDGEKINIDFLPEDANSFSVDIVPTTKTVKAYVDGSKVCQFLFTFATRTAYGEELRQQIDNIGFFEDFTKFIENNNLNEVFPELPEGLTPQKIEVTTSGYAYIPDVDLARYQIQCRLEYFEPADFGG